MEEPLKGDVIVVPFTFSDLSTTKKRPALVVASLIGDDTILCQITSQSRLDEYAIILNDNDFKEGSLNQTSIIRPNRLFTADRSILLYKVGSLKEAKIKEVEDKIINIVKK